MSNPRIDYEKMRETLADLLAVGEHAHRKTKAGDIDIVNPCRCLGKLPLYPCVALLIAEYIKFLRQETTIETIPELDRLLP